MSLAYQPDNDADPDDIWDTTFLSDRDVSAQVPINYVPHPGIAVTPVCFGNGIYANEATQKCLSNLLASQIRRFVFDLYWDVTNRRFQLCPVEIPNLENNGTSTAKRDLEAQHSNWNYDLAVRQTNTVNGSTTGSASPTTNSSSTGTATSAVAAPTTTMVGNDELVVLGPYQCSTDLTLASINSLFNQFLASTSNTLEAKINIWDLNLHVAALASQPNQSRAKLSSSDLPTQNELLRTYFDEIASVLYTPTELQTERNNLNTSWFSSSDPVTLPLTNYFTMNKLPDGDFSTTDGWPDEDYVQVAKGKRMLVGIDTIDDAMTGYNFTGDEDRIFAPGVISNHIQVKIDGDGNLQSGCFYDGQSFDINQLNNSWAVATINQVDPPDLGMTADNFTTCGISPLLNTTISGAHADVSALPYLNYGSEAVFSWAYGEPQTDANQSVQPSAKFRCALMVSNANYKGHWRVQFCSSNYRVACREANQPYRWRISSESVDFASASNACTENTTFDVPRTGLENTYLYNHILGDAQRESQSSLLDGVWINFNSLDRQSCWVTTGAEGECPYYEDADATHSRQILIPTIAALIVLILTVLTILVKCTTNRRNSRARKRGEGGWDYEGVPS